MSAQGQHVPTPHPPPPPFQAMSQHQSPVQQPLPIGPPFHLVQSDAQGQAYWPLVNQHMQQVQPMVTPTGHHWQSPVVTGQGGTAIVYDHSGVNSPVHSQWLHPPVPPMQQQPPPQLHHPVPFIFQPPPFFQQQPQQQQQQQLQQQQQQQPQQQQQQQPQQQQQQQQQYQAPPFAPPPLYEWFYPDGFVVPVLRLRQAPAAAAPVRVRVNKPPNFSAETQKELDKFDTWLSDVEAYLEAEGYVNDRSKIIVAESYMIGKAKSWLKPIIDERSLPAPTPRSVIWPLWKDAVTEHFRNPMREAAAIDQIGKIQQLSKSIREYDAEFQQLSADCPTFSEAAKIHYYKKGLNWSIGNEVNGEDTKMAMTRGQGFRRLDEVRNFAVRLGSSQEAYRANHPKTNRGQEYSINQGQQANTRQPQNANPTPRNPAPRAPPQNQQAAPQNQPRGAAGPPPAPRNNPPGGFAPRPRDPYAMDIDVGRMDPRRAANMRAGNCYVCSRPGHLARNCPNRPPARLAAAEAEDAVMDALDGREQRQQETPEVQGN